MLQINGIKTTLSQFKKAVKYNCGFSEFSVIRKDGTFMFRSSNKTGTLLDEMLQYHREKFIVSLNID